MSTSSKKKRVLIPLVTLSIASLLVGSSYFGNEKTTASAETVSYPQGEGYENGGYNAEAAMPAIGNWSYNVPFSGTETNEVKWEKDLTNLNYASTPAIDKDGNMYYKTIDKELISLDNTGKERWKKVFDTTNWGFVSSPAIAANGNIYVGAGNNLYALNANGEEIWKARPASGLAFNQTPAIDKDGVIYIVENATKKLYAFNPDGSVKWISSVALTEGEVTRSPVISKDGTIYIKTAKYFYAFDKTGAKKWQLTLAGASHIALTKDGKPVISALDTNNPGYLTILNPDGTLYKSVKLAESAGKYVVVSSYNDDIIVQEYRNVVAYDQEGTKKWEYQTSGTLSSQPLIDKNGVIYVVSDSNGLVTALNPDGTEKWHLNLVNYYSAAGVSFKSAPFSLSMDKNGTIYTAIQISKNSTLSYKIIAIGGENEPVIEEPCMGYLETVKQKLQDHSLTQEEIDAAQAELNDTLTQLNEEENK